MSRYSPLPTPFGWQELRDLLLQIGDDIDQIEDEGAAEHVLRSDIPVDSELYVPDGYVFQMVEPVTGDGEITGEGAFEVIDR